MKKVLVFLLVAVLIIPCFSLFTSAADLTNVAELKPYTTDIGTGTPGYGMPAEGEDQNGGYGDGIDGVRQRLTDGVIGGGADGGGYGIIGAQSTTQAIYVIDLGSVVNGILKLNMDMYSNSGWGIGDGISVEYALSTDGTTYTTVGTVLIADAVDKSAEGWTAYDYILELSSAKSARYVKMTATATNYVWSTEMQVFADETIVAESEAESTDESVAESVAESTAASTDDTSSVAETGDDSQSYIIYAGIIVISALCVIAVARKRIAQ
ncbi:MAG: hypothetical protein A2Y15_09020 [Clostridiales bacterium GWF2_36_10]|nr:MAG: hypothetical protein A2Y15_09020 [Clostridiales bacterium GWF2_36_10]HAN20612.1 hypothetical protein [Clostridiales bacterium]